MKWPFSKLLKKFLDLARSKRTCEGVKVVKDIRIMQVPMIPTPTVGSRTHLVLESIHDVDHGMENSLGTTVTTIARQTGVPRTAVRGILQALTDLGYVQSRLVAPSVLYYLSDALSWPNDRGDDI